ncbi:hypothetical protein D3C85_1109920 [compost metagenome]
MAAGIELIENLTAGDKRRHRHDAAPQSLAENQRIGTDLFVFEGEPLTSAPEAGLNFVEDQQRIGFITQLAQLAQETRRRYTNARLALNRLDQHGTGSFGNGIAKTGDVAKARLFEAITKRTEVGLVRRLGREADDGRCTAMEVVVGDHDFCAIGFDAFDPVTPASRCFDRGFDGLGTAVHRQCAGESGHPRQLFQKGAQWLAVEGPGHHADLVDLSHRRLTNTRMHVTVTDRRIRRHHVQVARAVFIDCPNAFTLNQHHRER